MDGENDGSKPYEQMDDLGGFPPYFWFNTQNPGWFVKTHPSFLMDPTSPAIVTSHPRFILLNGKVKLRCESVHIFGCFPKKSSWCDRPANSRCMQMQELHDVQPIIAPFYHPMFKLTILLLRQCFSLKSQHEFCWPLQPSKLDIKKGLFFGMQTEVTNQTNFIVYGKRRLFLRVHFPFAWFTVKSNLDISFLY